WLGELTAPRVEHVTIYRDVNPSLREFSCPLGKHASGNFQGPPTAPPRSSPVEVVSRQKVGGYDAVVLKADDANALDEWLVKNGYTSGPEQKAWLKWYTDHRWLLTAFKVSAADGPLRLAPVRLSFSADRPFYPYREPTAATTGKWRPRSLRVFLLAETEYAGNLGTETDPWPGETKWSKMLGFTKTDGVLTAGKLPEGLHGRDWHLTEFEDRSSPRPGTDEVYFSPTRDRSDVERPPIIEKTYVDRVRPRTSLEAVITVFTSLPVLTMIAGLLLLRVVRRRPPA
ncbi:MAG: DUF2330 domain-containing protein, partial [Fimbriiglobus sp.]